MSKLTPLQKQLESCNAKKGYKTLTHAEKAAIHVYSKHGKLLASYVCPVCGFHHLTSQLPEK